MIKENEFYLAAQKALNPPEPKIIVYSDTIIEDIKKRLPHLSDEDVEIIKELIEEYR